MKASKVTYLEKFRFLKRDWKLDVNASESFNLYQLDGDIVSTSIYFLYKYFELEQKTYKDGKTYYVVSRKKK